ncbi:MAG: YggS family pyridoxal phosphate-dependent enzyme [Desulfobacteraceae bacterium]|jgi:PLP dependent protein
MNDIQRMIDRLSAIKKRIANAASACGRSPEDVRLVAVGKTQPAERVRQAILSGADIIGENYIQEAREKFDQLAQLTVQWHFIGHLQRNKAKFAVRMFDLVHTVDSLRLARELDHQAYKINKIQPILIQVNISGEPSKSGTDEAQTLDLAQNLRNLKNLRLQGLMTMPPYFDAPEKARPFFRALRKLRDRLEGQLDIALRELSMGMTGDFEVAIEEGATLVRIGTALFGARQ